MGKWRSKVEKYTGSTFVIHFQPSCILREKYGDGVGIEGGTIWGKQKITPIKTMGDNGQNCLAMPFMS